jgi:DNA-binding transcriptional LysR family regulator
MRRELLDGLTTFLAVAERRSFTAAAGDLGITPQAVSLTIKGLEARIGVPLFGRTTRAVELTEAGRRLLDGVGPSVGAITAAIDDAASLGGEPTGLLRINLPQPAAELLIQPRLGAFCGRYPKIKLELFVDDRLIDIVGQGFDAGIRLGGMLDADMISTPLTPEEPFSIVGSPTYFSRRGRPSRPDDLARHACINFRMTRGLYRWEVDVDGKEAAIPVDGPLIVNTAALAVTAAEAGLGLAYLMDRQVTSGSEEGRLERVLEGLCPSSPGFHIYFPTRAKVLPKLRAFIDFFHRARA